jgi:DNA-binding transcriptional ArsR family regulator
VPKYQAGLDGMFHALADGSRRAMVERLARGPASVSELARPFDMSLPAVVQHLGVLEQAGIVTSEKVGRVRTYQLAPDGLAPCRDWISRQQLPAERRLDRLGQFLDSTGRKPTTTHQNTPEDTS